MPVDAHVFATADEEVDEQFVRTLAADLADFLGADRFRNDDGTSAVQKVARANYNFLPDDLPHAPSVLQVELSSPYYGPGYERGSWPEIAAVLEFLRRRLPGGRVWYGNDGGDWVREVTIESLDALWDHWARNGSRPYYGNRPSA